MVSKLKTKLKRRHKDRHRTPPGSPPGTLMVDPEAPKPVIRVMSYGPEALHEQTVESVGDVETLLGKHAVTWVDVAGLGDGPTLQRLGEVFGLHKLVLEDVVHVHQRAKVEAYGDCYFIVARTITLGETVESEQISLFLGKDYVVTFQERPGDPFGPVRERIRAGLGKIRATGPDYLVYALLDAVIDGYFPVLEAYGERLDDIEEEIVTDPGPKMIERIHGIKKDLQVMRRAVFPLRDAVNTLIRDGTRVFEDETRIYLRDCYDHTVQIMDLVETFRELGTGLMDSYLSVVSNRMNEVMKVLTVIATIFIPLTFIAGVYGMNFDPKVSRWNMPELEWDYGYPFSLVLMVATTVVLLAFFRKKRWI